LVIKGVGDGNGDRARAREDRGGSREGREGRG